ncbi:hypothetical protein [Paenibacillus protaetiae]|uniref:Uncharacterized protein n=1 Tax=Paenibacillus protaetiae TaxID=2509456 RepID=A0A4P6EY67_9BACL|nr:hypothetical protein [Paenibacillus protaetiae]QAY67645.1 hypothetical protein ET464_15900 [Paenibacillus protaetiae]
MGALFELHDLIPYFFSISVIASFAYAAFLFRQHREISEIWHADASHRVLQDARQEAVSVREPLGRKLVRSIKRKESPDGDSSDCAALCL